ncbi:transcriptional regulator [Roseibium aquae]|uniref:Transcriptional regulator n=1 Tax=Roseibium aquae TaxID=1323746 RepID=A0A916TAE1_9HYPH|nr:MarR family winged helix-turn-helix transcriptional regulator [Roseibium aquae]GGB35082.1 transcriptional regulator [Roseibium aquae]
MADINFKTDTSKPPRGGREPQGDNRAAPNDTVPFDLIELLFFAYRDFTADPDDVLSEFGFGRAHHRVLHFVNRNPDLVVTDLLGILKITKQSLGRVLKQLVDEGYIRQIPGASDRRQRHLRATDKGQELAMRLARLQAERLDRAIMALPDDGAEIVRQFLFQMINPDGRGDVAALIDAGRDTQAPPDGGTKPKDSRP